MPPTLFWALFWMTMVMAVLLGAYVAFTDDDDEGGPHGALAA